MVVWLPVDYATLGQYTGIDDKNQTEIFDGYIVKCLEVEKGELKWILLK